MLMVEKLYHVSAFIVSFTNDETDEIIVMRAWKKAIKSHKITYFNTHTAAHFSISNSLLTREVWCSREVAGWLCDLTIARSSLEEGRFYYAMHNI